MTNIIQNLPDFHYEEIDIHKHKKGLNPRYSYFKQNYFTAGDSDQFFQNWKVLPQNERKEITNTCRLPVSPKVDWVRYKDLCIHDYYNTFKYIEDKFKKGCFIQLHSNEMKTFLPFSKQNFRNEWGVSIEIEPRFKTINNMMKYLAEYDKNFPYDEKRIHRDMSAWYGNNGLVRFEYPLSESDTGYNMIKDMFECLVREREVPDFDFFLNKRDFPILKGDGTEPYEAFFGFRKRLISHHYPKYAPIFSMNTTVDHVDIPIPTWEDWRRVAYQSEQKMFAKEFYKYPSIEEIEETSWENKKDMIVFRGASTGTGTTTENNIRLFFANIAKNGLKDKNGNIVTDIGITKWNLRPRKNVHSKYLTTIHLDTLDIPLKEYMSPLEQSKYKYILHLPGHTCAYRLSLELFFGSVIFIYPCKNKLWFFDNLKAWKHYIPLNNTFSEEDLMTKIQWCQDNPQRAKEIADNARLFAKEYLTRAGILDYLQKLFINIHSKVNKVDYIQNNMLDIQRFQYNKCFSLKKLYFFEKPILFMDDLFEMILEQDDTNTNIQKLFQQNNVIWEYFFEFLFKTKQLNFFLNEKCNKKTILNSKNSDIDIYEFCNKRWIKKTIISNWKHNELHEVYIGYKYINKLALDMPNFVYTYYHYNNIKENTKEKYTNVFVDYKPYNTLDVFLRNKKLSFQQLIEIWGVVCLVLEKAQQYCGFIHMDLYPWNIIIKEQKFTNVLNDIQLESNFIPIIIDYGNSHVVENGLHLYSTTPFIWNRFQDIFCLVFSSLDIFLFHNTISKEEQVTLIEIMNFFAKSNIFKNNSFMNVSQIRQFIKKHKRFSVMLGLDKSSFRNFRPLTFYNYLLDKNVLSCKHQKPKNQIIHYKYDINPFSNFSNLLYILENCFALQIYNSNDIIILLTRILKNFCENSYNMKDEYPTYTKNIEFFFNKQMELHRYNFYKYFKKVKTFIEKSKNIQIFDINETKIFPQLQNLNINTQNIIDWINIHKHTLKSEIHLPQLPLLNTHICQKCDYKNYNIQIKNSKLTFDIDDKFVFINTLKLIHSTFPLDNTEDFFLLLNTTFNQLKIND
tara:strand:+ start:504 stop:3713 length:3210 start_codon:yes stop_codon:yes gene_type:complete